MSEGYDRFENEGSGGGSFVIGLLTGTVLGAGLGMLFAPKAGAELRNQLSEKAGNLANTASDGYRRASEAAGEWAEKGRDMAEKGKELGRDVAEKGKEFGRDVYDKTREAVSRGTEEAQRYVREATSTTPGTTTPSTDLGGSTHGARRS
jgi:gas vesicle protein